MNAPATSASQESQLPEAYRRKLETLVNAHRAFKQGQFEEAKQQLLPIVKEIGRGNADHTDLRSLLLFADAHQCTGHFESAYKNYVIALELDPDLSKEVLPHLLNCLPNLTQPIDAPIFAEHVMLFIEHPNFDNIAIDRLVINMLVAKFALEDPDANVELVDIVTDPLLLLSLNHLLLGDPRVEFFLRQLRTLVFTNVLENGLAEPLIPITLAMAQHAERTGHMFYISAAEQEVLKGIETFLSNEGLQNKTSSDDILELANVLLAYNLYEPIRQLAIADHIVEFDSAVWPNLLAEFFDLTLYQHRQEREIAEQISTFAITDERSQQIRAKYENTPYPRWENIYQTPRALQYLDLFPNLNQVLRKPKAFKKQISCLVAGCGTGQQPIWLAKNVQHMNITAIDLSRSNLAYAARMSQKLEAPKIDFVCTDLLNADHIGKKFDVIECTGVLHDMAEPEAGLSTLLSVLKPHGLLHLALHSRPARERLGVNRARTHLAEQNRSDDNDAMREIRHNLLSEPGDFTLKTADFFSMGECRDLLFNVQEHQFDLVEISAMLNKYDLEFLGFSGLLPEVHQLYRETFPEDTTLRNLQNWENLERLHPAIFSTMYQFHCQRRSPS